jgi:hypothetical protein
VIAALFVLHDGPYAGRQDVDPWPEPRDARLYDGPFPVVAHPPCERWGRYWSGGPSGAVRRQLGDDAGCFESALRSVLTWGGVLEHPEASHAFRTFGINNPPRRGGWVPAGIGGGFVCCVEQGHYGHAARKATWLFACHVDDLPELKWGTCGPRRRPDQGFHSAEERRRAIRTGICQRLSNRQRKLTPAPFAELLIGIAAARRIAPPNTPA